MKRNPGTETPAHSPYGRRRVLKVVLFLLILSAGAAGASYITKSTPKVRKRPPQKTASLVKVQALQPASEQVMVPAMGTVIPARQVQLKSRVSGEILWIHREFREGGLLTKGEVVLQIDPRDYQVAVTLARARVKDAESKLRLAEEDTAAAREEWRSLYLDKDRANLNPPPLVAKEPQLEAARAQLEAERADLKKALLDLERTRLKAPFNAVVREKFGDIGSQVSPQDTLADIVGTDEYWIRVSLPMDRLKWIHIPEKGGAQGSQVRVLHGNGIQTLGRRTGRVVKLLSDLETDGRMARLLVAVEDPLGLKKKQPGQPPLLIGDCLQVEIEGKRVDNVYRIPRTALHDDSKIWIAGDDEKLHIREVKTLWRDTRTVLFRDGFRPGEQLIVSDLPAAVEGMQIQIDHVADHGLLPQRAEKRRPL